MVGAPQSAQLGREGAAGCGGLLPPAAWPAWPVWLLSPALALPKLAVSRGRVVGGYRGPHLMDPASQPQANKAGGSPHGWDLHSFSLSSLLLLTAGCSQEAGERSCTVQPGQPAGGRGEAPSTQPLPDVVAHIWVGQGGGLCSMPPTATKSWPLVGWRG